MLKDHALRWGGGLRDVFSTLSNIRDEAFLRK